MTVAEFIFDFLQKKGLDTVYMVSGSSAMWLTDALYRNKKLKAICCHHEQAAAMAADGYGRVHGIPGACLVTIGPGATNAITGVAQAYLDSSPMFVISGQVNSNLLRKQVETKIRQLGTQTLNLEPIVTSITKFFHVVMEPKDIAVTMDRAYNSAMSGRKGPVWIDVPVDIQNRQIPVEYLDCIEKKQIQSISKGLEDTQQYGENPDYGKLVHMIQMSNKPLILAGAGVKASSAQQKLEQIAETLHVPIVTSRGGIDVIPSNFPLYVGRPGAYGDRPSHFALSQCDCLLILGSRLSASTIGYYPHKLAKGAYKIMVDIDPLELARDEVPIDEKFCMDVGIFFNDLWAAIGKLDTEDVERNKIVHEGWNRYLQKLRNRYPVVQPEYANEKQLNEYYVTDRLARLVPENANIIVDTGSVCNVVSQSWILKRGQNYLISGGLSCMGFWATSIGAYQKGKELIAITGDGSAQMNVQEMATLKTTGIPLKLFIYHNHGYMLIRHNQHNYMNDRFLGVGPDSGLETPDFVKIAKAYGLKAYQIENHEELEQLIPVVLAEKEPTVCQILVQEFAPIIPRIASKVMPDGTLKAAEFDDLFPFLSEEEYQKNLYGMEEGK